MGRLIASVSAQDRARVIGDFAASYARVGASLLSSPERALRELAASVSCMFRMLVDPRFRVSWGTTAAIVFALGYFVCPFDLIPDSIPVAGFLDDAALVAEIALLISGDIRRFGAERAAPGVASASPTSSPAAAPPVCPCSSPGGSSTLRGRARGGRRGSPAAG